MSGIEVVALVAGIVSAFTGAGSLFRSWRRDRKERQRQEKNQHLEQALVKGSSDVQKTYDDDFRRLGPMFARGDEISRSTLAEQLIKLQGTVISVLTGNTPISALVYPDHDLLSDTSIAVRLRSLSALAEQYQRMSQAAPVPTTPTMRWIWDCDGTISFRSIATINKPSLVEYHCSSCNWRENFNFANGSSHKSCVRTYIEYFHRKGKPGLYSCALCNVRPSLEFIDLLKHLKDKHGYDVYEHAGNNKDGCGHHDLVASLLAGETNLAAN